MQPLLDDGYQDVDRDRDPHLGLHGVLGSSEERLDAEMLLDPPEEEFDLPPLLVEQGDALRGKGKIVGQENQFLLVLDVEEPDATEFVGIMLGRVDARQGDGLVGTHTCRFVDGPGVHTTKPQVRLGPCDEEGQTKRESMKSFEVEISPIHHIIRSGFGNKFVEDMHVVPLAVGDLDERGDVPPQIQKGVEFDGGLPFAESRPRKKRKAQVDRRGVEGVHRVLQFHCERIVDVQALGGPDQDLGEVGVDAVSYTHLRAHETRHDLVCRLLLEKKKKKTTKTKTNKKTTK